MNQPDETLTQIEQELTRAMRAVDPPEGFAERTVARAQESGAPRARVLTMPRRSQFWASGAIAAAVLAGAFFGEQTHVRRERQREERAQQQFDTAMRITNETLDHVRLQLQQAGVSTGNEQKQ